MDAFLSLHAPGFWLVLTLLVGVVVLGLRPYLPNAVQQWSIPGYWGLLPYAALITGGVSPRLMGVMYIEWRNSLTLGVGLALAMIALAGVARITLLSRQHTGDDTASPAPDRDGFAGSIGGSIAGSIGISGAEEWFWCFLRAAVEETLLLTQLSLDLPAYWSIWIAATLALPFSLLSRSNAYHVNAYHWLVKGAILVMTSILFFYTRNFWLCWAVHAIIWLLLAQPAAVQIASTRKSRSQQSPKRG